MILRDNPLWGLQLGPAVQVKLEEKFLIAYSVPVCCLEVCAVSFPWVCLQLWAYSWHWKSNTRHIYPLICNKWPGHAQGRADSSHRTIELNISTSVIQRTVSEHTVNLSSCSSMHKSYYFQCPPVILVQSNNSWRPELAVCNGKSPCSTGTVFKWAHLDSPESSALAPVTLPAGYKKGFNSH